MNLKYQIDYAFKFLFFGIIFHSPIFLLPALLSQTKPKVISGFNRFEFHFSRQKEIVLSRQDFLVAFLLYKLMISLFF
jgi:hypothetical protein